MLIMTELKHAMNALLVIIKMKQDPHTASLVRKGHFSLSLDMLNASHVLQDITVTRMPPGSPSHAQLVLTMKILDPVV